MTATSTRRGNHFGPAGTPRVVVVGAGFGGIGTGVKLKKAGIETFTIYEKSERVGGTWWDNQYPGCEVDIHSHLYSYYFKRHDWTRTHASRRELQAYLEETMGDYALWSHVRLGIAVERAEWDESRHAWELTLDNGESDECHVLIAATGFLNVPRLPDWPGLDEFERVKFHTSRWSHDHDLTGTTIALVGTGSTAAQILPELQKVAKKVYLFQREPGWVVPKGVRDFTPEERARLSTHWGHTIERWKQLARVEMMQFRGAVYRPGNKVNTMAEEAARAYIESVFTDRPDLAKAVTPTYPFAGKRPVQADTFYPALLEDNVELVPRAVERVTRTGVVDADGVEREVDVLVMSTGFQPTNYLACIEVVGRDGQSFRDYWAGEPRVSGNDRTELPELLHPLRTGDERRRDRVDALTRARSTRSMR